MKSSSRKRENRGSRVSALRNGELDRAIMELIHEVGSFPDEDLAKEMIVTVLKLVEDRADRGDLKIVNSAFREMRYAFKIFAPYRHIRKVSVFGSARVRPEDPLYRQAAEFSLRLRKRGYMIITGAGEGIMRAAQQGAGREKSFGVNINLPFEQLANEFIDKDPKLINFKYFFTRKLFFMKETSGVVLFPGGFGTHDEGFEALTLIQTGKSDPLPVVFLDVPGGGSWKAWRAYVEDHLYKLGMISHEDLSLFKVTDDVDAAVDEIITFYRNYHSSRYVDGLLVIRVQQPVSDRLVEDLNANFGDIVSEGKIEAASALEEESNETEIAHLPRITLRFNRRNFGRLRQLIDAINRG